MKRLLASLALLLASVVCPAQSVLKGWVTMSIPLPVHGGLTWDFAIIGDADGKNLNNFAYKDPAYQGPFKLQYQGFALCEKTCQFEGNFTTWFTPTSYGNGCVVYAGELQGSMWIGGNYHELVTGFYEQTVCTTEGATRYAAGDVSFLVLDN